MDFQQTLKGYKVAMDKELGRYFDLAIASARQQDELTAKALEQTKKIALSGGKRIRGALVQCGYAGVGGKEKKKILQVAVAIELLHLFFLIHDDVIDCGDLRHGQETLQKFFAKKKNGRTNVIESEHFGNSLAIIVGDLLFAKANEAILRAGFGEKETLTALTYLQEVVKTTILGQTQDIAMEKTGQASEESVLAMYENKTARYTFEGPLKLGALLAGTADKKTLSVFARYASVVGKAYQLQDDLLGVFGKKEKTGKSTVSDIEEGKLSLLVIRARAMAKGKDQKSLQALLGKKKLSVKEVQIFQAILIKTGAKKYTQDLAQAYFTTGKAEIEKAVLLPQAKNFLINMVEYLEGREI